jgi:DNA-binding NarL/FixJ family response regulator
VLRAGARGFLLKSDAGRDLVAAVEALQLQRTFFTTRVSRWCWTDFSIGRIDRTEPRETRKTSTMY